MKLAEQKLMNELRKDCSKRKTLRKRADGPGAEFECQDRACVLIIDLTTSTATWTVAEKSKHVQLDPQLAQELRNREEIVILQQKRRRVREKEAQQTVTSELKQSLFGVLGVQIENVIYVLEKDVKERRDIAYVKGAVLKCTSADANTSGILRAFKNHFLVDARAPAICVIREQDILSNGRRFDFEDLAANNGSTRDDDKDMQWFNHNNEI